MDTAFNPCEAWSAPESAGLPGQRILMVASEVHPLVKTGGLADVCAALPGALVELGADVRVLMPGYPCALDRLVGARAVAELGPVLGIDGVRLVEGFAADRNVPVWLLDCPTLFGRHGGPYQGPDGEDWPDNALRFGVLCRAAAMLCEGVAGIGWRPQIVHCHDWHSGLVPYYLRRLRGARPRTVFTIHNAAFQGNFAIGMAAALDLDADALGPDGLEFYGQLSFLKAGIRYADRITTVSPSYAREITTPEFGCGMHGLLQARAADLTGILNGIDTRLWDPARDPLIPHRYSGEDRGGKRGCKLALQSELGLQVDARRPLAIMVNRLTRQKMSDIVLTELPVLLRRDSDLQFAMLGEGDRDLEQGFAELAAAYPGRVSAQIGYTEAAAHRLQAGGDLLLHGSRFEPCGLSQMYAMRYGTLPLVRRVGGLADSVVDAGTDAQAPGATGFAFDAGDGDALVATVERSLVACRQRPEAWQRLQRQAMAADFGWRRSAQAYRTLYAESLAPPPPIASVEAGSSEHAYH